MTGIIEHVANVMVPVLLCVLLGYALAWFKAPFDRKLFGSLVSNVGYPTLILSHLAKEHIQLGTFLSVLGAALAMVVIFGTLGFLVLKLMRVSIRAYLAPMMLSNVGNIGLPVATLAFGAQGGAVAIGFIVVVLTAIFTIGIAIPMGRPDFKALARQPVIYAVILALVLLATGWKIPGPVDQSLEILGGLAIPIMLLTLGHSLETLKLSGVSRAVLLSLIHIGISAGGSLCNHIHSAAGCEDRERDRAALLYAALRRDLSGNFPASARSRRGRGRVHFRLHLPDTGHAADCPDLLGDGLKPVSEVDDALVAALLLVELRPSGAPVPGPVVMHQDIGVEAKLVEAEVPRTCVSPVQHLPSEPFALPVRIHGDALDQEVIALRNKNEARADAGRASHDPHIGISDQGGIVRRHRQRHRVHDRNEPFIGPPGKFAQSRRVLRSRPFRVLARPVPAHPAQGRAFMNDSKSLMPCARSKHPKAPPSFMSSAAATNAPSAIRARPAPIETRATPRSASSFRVR